MGNSKIKDANDFLQMCKNLSKTTYVDKKVVYSMLENYKIKSSDLQKNETIHPLHYFEEWNNMVGKVRTMKMNDFLK